LQYRSSVLAVQRSCGLKLFLAAAFLLTLAPKLLLYHPETAADHEVLGEAVAGFLLKIGFESHIEKRFGNLFIHANSGKCRMLISEATPQGWDHNSNEIWAKPVGRLSYIFDGAVHVDEPFLAPMLDRWWMRLRIKLGLSPNYHPVLAVAASDDCAIDSLPWWQLSVLS
jgi:hypothetical protein